MVRTNGVALLSQEDTALHHTRSPRCSGSLLRGSLAITTTGLPPVSHQDLSRRTIWLLSGTLKPHHFKRAATWASMESDRWFSAGIGAFRQSFGRACG